MKEALQALSEKIKDLKQETHTEEATKTAFILPFIALLGYDVFNPKEVIPEFTADIGTKKGEKVDYALLKEGTPVLIIECKHWEEDLAAHNSQLHRYFAVTRSRFALLTNGSKYLFFTDLEEPNKMDKRPFLEVDLEHIKESNIQELARFHKTAFNVESIVDAAGTMKYTKAIRTILEQEFTHPSDDFTRFLARKVYPGKVTAKLIEQFSSIIKKAISQYLNEAINDRLQSALAKEMSEQKEQIEELEKEPTETPKIVTTQEEIDGFNIVKAILSRSVDLERIFPRDTQSYFGILLDDTNRKPLCRLHFNRRQKYLGVIEMGKDEIKIPIEKVSDIYQHSEQLMQTAQHYLQTD